MTYHIKIFPIGIIIPFNIDSRKQKCYNKTVPEKSESEFGVSEMNNEALIPSSAGVDTNTVFTYEKKRLYSFLKRFFDIILSLCALIVLSPLLIVITILISLWDGKGHPIFVQTRVGKKGRLFKLYKFRSMCLDAEAMKAKLQKYNEMDGPAFKMKDDPRITGIGKFIRKTNIDELPQFINILKGDMSIVGPRPPLPDEVAQYSESDMKRLAVTPGLTCYWQASRNRNDISFEQWMEMDRKYIAERSLRTDAKIILKTAYVVLVHRDGR